MAPAVTIHDPEHIFDPERVRAAVAQLGATFPVSISVDIDPFLAAIQGTAGVTELTPNGWDVHVAPYLEPGTLNTITHKPISESHLLWHELGHVFDLTQRMKREYGRVDYPTFVRMSEDYHARYAYDVNPGELAADRFAQRMAPHHPLVA